MEHEFLDAVNGTSGEIIVPETAHPISKLVKVVNFNLHTSELSCTFSHFLSWIRCIEYNEPIVVLEHDALMLKPYEKHPYENAIVYLGANGVNHYNEIPGTTYRYSNGTASYAIDVNIARSMVAKIIKNGICTSSDVFMRTDDFCIVNSNEKYCGLQKTQTTISNRVSTSPFALRRRANNLVTFQ